MVANVIKHLFAQLANNGYHFLELLQLIMLECFHRVNSPYLLLDHDGLDFIWLPPSEERVSNIDEFFLTDVKLGLFNISSFHLVISWLFMVSTPIFLHMLLLGNVQSFK